MTALESELLEALKEASVALRIGHNTLVALEKAHAAIAKAESAVSEPIAYFDFQERGFYWAKNVVHGPVPVSVKVEPMPLFSAPPAAAVSEPVKPVAYFQLVPFGKSMIYEQVVIHSKEDEGVFPLYAAPPAAVPLSDAEIVYWWNEENGLEDCQMCFKKDFVQVVRAVERKHGIGEKQ